MLLTKSETENQKIVGVFYDKMTHMETRRLEIGDNEREFPTDCVSYVSKSGDTLYVALNKRTKSSEPLASEIHAYDLTSNMEVGFITKHNSTCRFLCEAVAGRYVAAFMLKYCIILEKETLEPLQKVSYNKYNIYGVVQGGCLAYDQPEITISFYDPVESISRVYFIKFTPSLAKPEGNTSYSNVLT